MDVDAVLSRRFETLTQRCTPRDCAAYALGVGYGADPMDTSELAYVYGPELRAVSSMALVLCNPGVWQSDPALKIDWLKAVLFELELEVHRPLSTTATVSARPRVESVLDLGRERGAFIVQRREIVDVQSGARVATIGNTSLCRGDGGFGGARGEWPGPFQPPSRAPDAVCELTTLPQAALLYDLNGIVNPLHSWPPAAKRAGYERPILHGLCVMGFAHHALARSLAGGDADRVTRMTGRFRREVYPGDLLRTEAWADGASVVYRTGVPARDVVVLTGTARAAPARAEPARDDPGREPSA